MGIVAGALLGAAGVGQGKRPGASQYELDAQRNSQASLNNYSNLVAAGPGMADYQTGLQSQRDLGSLLKQYQNSGNGLYNFEQGNQLAAQAFAGQRQQLQTTFEDQLRQANQSAALAGRGGNDPILRARLAQEQSRQQAQLTANQSAAAVDFARQYATDQIGVAGQRANVLSSLGNQALTNQQNLFSMSNSALQQERQYRMAQPTQYSAFERALQGGIQGGQMAMQIGSMAMGAGGAPSSSGGFSQGFGQGLGQAAPQAFGAPQQAAPAPQQAPVIQQGPLAPQYVAPYSGNAVASSFQPYAPGASTAGPWAPAAGLNPQVTQNRGVQNFYNGSY